LGIATMIFSLISAHVEVEFDHCLSPLDSRPNRRSPLVELFHMQHHIIG
jgi:hypothetical protein